jgi:hypothetical protein
LTPPKPAQTAEEKPKPKPDVVIPPKAEGAKEDNDALNAQMKEIDGEIKAAEESLAKKKLIWAGEVAAHQLSKVQEIQLVMKATEQEYQAELSLLQKEKALGGLKQSQIQEINNKIEQLQAKHDQTMIKLDQDALAEETATWQRYADIVTATFNSQLKGLITGTTNFRNAMKSIFTDILMKFIEVIENMVVKWAVVQLAMTTAMTTGAQARGGAELAGQNAGNAGTIVSIMRSISASAGETFAGVFGFLSPVLGPAASPAAASEATVLSVGAVLAAFDVGSWSLPSDMLAQVHRGEIIIRSGSTPWAQGVLSGAANAPGVNTVHVHHATHLNISTIDGRSTAQFFKDNSRTILRTINESVHTGSLIGLAKLST